MSSLAPAARRRGVIAIPVASQWTAQYIDATRQDLKAPSLPRWLRLAASMDDSTLYARMHANLRAFCRLMGSASPGARAVELPGVVAAVAPVTPHRSLFN